MSEANVSENRSSLPGVNIVIPSCRVMFAKVILWYYCCGVMRKSYEVAMAFLKGMAGLICQELKEFF